MVDLRERLSPSLVELAFTSHLPAEGAAYPGFDYALRLRLAATRLVYMQKAVGEVR